MCTGGIEVEGVSTGGIEVEGRVHWWDRSGGACPLVG